MFRSPPGTSFYGRYTYVLHRRAAVLEAIATGVLLLNEFVARKTLGASALGITLLLMIPTVAQLGNLYWAGPSKWDPRSVFLLVGLPSRLLLLPMLWVESSAAFIVLAAIAGTASTVVIPAQNAIYQANYAVGERGRVYSKVSAVASLVTVVVATALGWLYDKNPQLYRLSYPLAAVCAVASSYSWYRIRWRRRPELHTMMPSGPAMVAALPRPAALPLIMVRRLSGVFSPFREAARLFAADRDFLRFELAFMTYGIAFMMLQPVLPLFLVDELKVDYAQASHAKGLLFYGVLVVLLPFVGRVSDRYGVLRIASVAFTLLSLFPLLLVFAHGIELVYAGYLIFGAAMAGVNVAWNLGPLSFTEGRSAERYMGAHVALVGIRGFIGYPLGLFLMRLSSARLTFAFASALALVAAIVTIRLERDRRTREG